MGEQAAHAHRSGGRSCAAGAVPVPVVPLRPNCSSAPCALHCSRGMVSLYGSLLTIGTVDAIEKLFGHACSQVLSA